VRWPDGGEVRALRTSGASGAAAASWSSHVARRQQGPPQALDSTAPRGYRHYFFFLNAKSFYKTFFPVFFCFGCKSFLVLDAKVFSSKF
jgi:hypothetical protein